MGFWSKSFKRVAGGAVLAGGLAFADQATGGHGYNVINKYLQNAGYQGFQNIPWINDLANATKSLTSNISQRISTYTGLSSQNANYVTAGLGAGAATLGTLAAFSGISGPSFSLSNTWNSMGKGNAYRQAQRIADLTAKKVKGPWYHRSKATEAIYQNSIQTDLNDIKSKASLVLTGLGESSDPYKKRVEMDNIKSALSALKIKGVITGDYSRLTETDFDANGGDITGLLSTSDQEILGEWTDSGFGNELNEITGRKAKSATKSSWTGLIIKTAAIGAGAYFLDQQLLGGWGLDKLKDGLSGIYNAQSLNPFDLGVQAGQGFDPGLMKIGAGALMLVGGGWGAMKIAKEFGGGWGLASMLALGAGMGYLGTTSVTDVNWSNKNESFLTGGNGSYGEFANKYFPDWAVRMSGP